MSNDHKYIQIQSVEQTFKTNKGLFPALRDIHLDIAKGEFVALIGHSGCGKTTVLNVLAGLDTASDGYVFMDGREVAGPSLERGVVFQGHALMPWLSVRKNIAFAVRSKWPQWSAAQVNAQSGSAEQNWSRVVAVRICLQMVSY